MAAQKGREILIKRHDGTSQVTIGGMRAKSIRINGAQAADVSDSDSTWRELLAGAGLKSVSFQGGGVFKDSAPENGILQDILNDVSKVMQFIVPGLGTFEGTFIIQNLEYSGGHEGELNYSGSWESTGTVTFT